VNHSLLIASAMVLGLALPALAVENTSHVDQIGDLHMATVDQHGDAINDSTVLQKDGDGSDANVQQGGFGALLTNNSNILQLGFDQAAVIRQEGDGNFNSSDTIQSGDGNSVSVQQGGTRNVSDSFVNQTGSNNGAIVFQN
jgi:hypothetical protein